jgi:tRNA(Ile)-lysidine synthetase-like protein
MLATMPNPASAPTARGGPPGPSGITGLPRLAREFHATLRRVVPEDARLLLGVSGGSDSMALLAAAHTAVPEADRLVVAHVRHGLRADDELDAGLVETAAASLNRPCRILLAPPPAPGAGRSETAARRRRLAALAEAARQCGAQWVLLAHHLDDDLQTTMLHLARGHRGDRALAGIPMVRSLDAHTRILRPFLVGPSPPDRRALFAYREEAGLPFREDPMNHEAGVARNRIRDWLDSADAALRSTLRRAQLAARARLATRMGAAAEALETGLSPEGLGCSISRVALGDAHDADHDQDFAERLRLAAACLAEPRRLDTRRAVLQALLRLLESGSGQMSLPTSGTPLLVRASRAGLHFPHEALAAGPSAARVLRAVCAGSLYF